MKNINIFTYIYSQAPTWEDAYCCSKWAIKAKSFGTILSGCLAVGANEADLKRLDPRRMTILGKPRGPFLWWY